MVRPERLIRLAVWLRTLAIHEEGTARALSKLGHLANASHCTTRAKLFEEIARHLEETGAGGVFPAPGASEYPETEKPPSGPENQPSRRKRL